MSRNHIEKIVYPKCNTESDFVLWDSINTMLDPEMKAKVRTGEAFRWECPKCGYRSNADYATLYHQMEDHVMIYYVPGDKTEAIGFMKGIFRNSDGEAIEPGIDLKLDNDYCNRIVGTQNELREKLVILDEGLDDHVIELMKLIMKVHLQNNDQDLKIEEFLFDIDQEGTRFFAINLGNGEWGHTDFVQDMYDSIAEDMKDIIENDDEVVVDFNWALAAIQKGKR